MKTLILGGLLIMIPAGFSSAAIYMKYDGVEGESALTGEAEITLKAQPTPTRATRNSDTPTSNEPQTTRTAPASDPQEASVDAYIKIPDIEGESGEEARKKGNVEVTWKVEEGESAAPASENPSNITREGEKGIEPDEIDFMGESENATNFGILLDTGGDDDEESEEKRTSLEHILLAGMQEANDVPTEDISLNYGTVKVKVKQQVKLFGLFPVEAKADVEIDAEERVKVQFPWWAFLASDKNPDDLGSRVFTTLSNVLKTRHDSIQSTINNIR